MFFKKRTLRSFSFHNIVILYFHIVALATIKSTIALISDLVFLPLSS